MNSLYLTASDPNQLDLQCGDIRTVKMSTSTVSRCTSFSSPAVAAARSCPPAPARTNSSRSAASCDAVVSIEPLSIGSSTAAPRTASQSWLARHLLRSSSATTVMATPPRTPPSTTTPFFGEKEKAAVIASHAPAVCFEAAVNFDESTEEKDLPFVRSIGARIARALISNSGHDVRRAHLCGDLDFFASHTAAGPDIAARNVAMMLSSLLGHEKVGDALRAAGVFDAPNPAEVARLVQAACARGYDSCEPEALGHNVTGKGLTSVQVAMLLHGVGIRAHVKSFDNTSGIARKRFLDWVLSYFESMSGGVNALTGESTKKTGGRCVAPIFLQWEGHSVTVCGAERTHKGETRILVLDPAAPAADAVCEGELPTDLFCLRRGESHQQLQAPTRLQVVFLDQSPLLSEPKHSDMAFSNNMQPKKRVHDDSASYRERRDTNSSSLPLGGVEGLAATREEQQMVGEALAQCIESWRGEAAPPQPVVKAPEPVTAGPAKIVKGAESGRRARHHHNAKQKRTQKRRSKMNSWFCFWVPFFTGYQSQ